ncbi:MAG: hypothetical protein R3B96_15100 [Pirellulaceae bacterium]
MRRQRVGRGASAGFPSLVYTHGWSVGLWIGGYMIVPLVSMGLLAKENESDRTEDRHHRAGRCCVIGFGSSVCGTVCTLLIVLFLSINLIGQFKAGATIIETLLAEQPIYEMMRAWVARVIGDGLGLAIAAREPGYVLKRSPSRGVIVIYTAYGGFAVVWTDVLQGLIMVAGVALLLPMTLWAVGGFGAAHRQLARMTPPENTHLVIARIDPGTSDSSSSRAAAHGGRRYQGQLGDPWFDRGWRQTGLPHQGARGRGRGRVRATWTSFTQRGGIS